ncbi:MAG: hypothetical protein IKH75_06470 [Ruminococcus sp.]|nr:hypothetical protein [Ruminococcus sp.]
MLLHRVGGYSGDMFFDLNSDTVVNYGAFMVGCGFALHTYEYKLTESENGLTIAVRYGLNDGKAEEISGEQMINITYMEVGSLCSACGHGSYVGDTRYSHEQSV